MPTPPPPPLSLLFFVLVLSFPPSSSSLRFDLRSGHTKCISEDINVNAMSVGKYRLVHPNDGDRSHRVTVRVSSPYGNNVHYADHVEAGNFGFTSSEAGNYMACFWASDHRPPATLNVDFDWRSGVAARDWTNVAKKGNVDVMELELRKMEGIVESIHEEMFFLREREEQMQDLNRRTNSQMAWFGFLSLAVCLSVVALQIWHLKSFFERKKLL